MVACGCGEIIRIPTGQQLQPFLYGRILPPLRLRSCEQSIFSSKHPVITIVEDLKIRLRMIPC